MVFAELDRRARWKRTHRTKLGVQMLTTFSYGALGVAFADSILAGKPFGVGNLASFAFGLFCGFAALYLAPEGERDDLL